MIHARPPKPEVDLLVSIVLFNPDIEKLKQCLDSVLSSRNISLRVEVQDNSPTPLAPELLQRYTSNDSLLTYNHGGTNVGFGAGHNLVIKKAYPENTTTIPYTLILNPDAYFDNSLLANMVNRMRTDPAIGLSIPRIINPDGTIQLVNKRLPTPAILFLRPLIARSAIVHRILAPWLTRYLLQDMDLKRPLICPFISGCFMFFRTDLLLELNGFDDRYFLYMEDVDLSRRAAVKGLNVVFSDLTCSHHWERGAYKNKKLFKLLITSSLKYFNKWGWFFDLESRRLSKQVRYYQAPTGK